MKGSFDHVAKKFAARRFLKRKVALEFRDAENRLRLFCDEPAIVASFASELRQEVVNHYGRGGTQVLMRGQAQDHAGMVPGLFRPPTHSIEPRLLVKEETLFESRVRRGFPERRFRRPDLAALLQHYGYRTTWLDVVDNLWTAVWFATHSIEPADKRIRCAVRRQKGAGWIYFMVANASRAGCTAIDLRAQPSAAYPKWMVGGVRSRFVKDERARPSLAVIGRAPYGHRKPRRF